MSPRLRVSAVALVLVTVAITTLAVPPINAAAQEPIAKSTFRPPQNSDRIKLGRFLFHDKIISGNKNISCATCHHLLTDTGDGLSLPIGEGALGLGVTRDTGSGNDAVHERVPRNAPHIFNLGAREFRIMFDDGRVAVDPTQPSGFLSPAGDNLPMGLRSVLAAQAMFPVTSATEMAGQSGENPIADAAAAGRLAGPGGVWELIADRLREIPLYARLFRQAFADVRGPADITYVHAANAIAAYEERVGRADKSPYDRFLAGDTKAMSPNAVEGMGLFFGKAGCSSCHNGPFLTDQSFHSIAMPQIGPGKGDGADGHDDFGRERVTGNSADRYKFRTPSLRNVEITGPWGHDGAYNTLEAVVRHHLDAPRSIKDYDLKEPTLPPRADLIRLDFIVMRDAARVSQIAASCELQPLTLRDAEVKALIEFLRALTDPRSHDLRSEIPMRVPSGLTLAE